MSPRGARSDKIFENRIALGGGGGRSVGELVSAEDRTVCRSVRASF